MRFTKRSTVALTTAIATMAALALSLASPTANAAPAAPPNAQRQAAEDALSAVQHAVGEGPQTFSAQPPSRDLTLLLTQLATRVDDLGPADRAAAQRLLARPSDNSGSDVVKYQNGVTVQNDCGAGEPGAGTRFCVNWVNTTGDAPSTADTNGSHDGDGVPDYVESVRTQMNKVWNTEVGQFGYKAPLKDTKGPNRKLDIYLANIGGQGYYGYCVPERRVGNAWAYSGYCVLDDDYSAGEFPTNTPVENLQVTAAHEFFHAVQFAYDAAEDIWLTEGTAAWMEDEVFDGVDDNLQYLATSPLSNPSRSLDNSATFNRYGNWIWWRYLSERLNRNVIRGVWERADDSHNPPGNRYSMQALDKELTSRHLGLGSAFAAFTAVNRAPEQHYSEGDAYPKAPSRANYTLSDGAKSSGSKAVTLDHMSAATIAANRGSLSGSGWKLKVNVDGPARSHEPRALVTSYDSSGAVLGSVGVGLNRNGVGSRNVAFGPGVDRVDVTFTNAGHAYARCWAQATQWSCSGKPQDDNERFTYKVTAVRP